MTLFEAVQFERTMPERVMAGKGDRYREQEDRPGLVELIYTPQLASGLPLENILPLLHKINVLEGILLTRLLETPTTANGVRDLPEKDQLLNPEEAATRLGVTVKWLYRHAKQLPFTRRLSRKALRFSEQGLQRWLAAKRA